MAPRGTKKNWHHSCIFNAEKCPPRKWWMTPPPRVFIKALWHVLIKLKLLVVSRRLGVAGCATTILKKWLADLYLFRYLPVLLEGPHPRLQPTGLLKSCHVDFSYMVQRCAEVWNAMSLGLSFISSKQHTNPTDVRNTRIQDEVVAAAAFLRQRYPLLGLEKVTRHWHEISKDFQYLSGILISWLYRHGLRPNVVKGITSKNKHVFERYHCDESGWVKATVSCSWTVSRHRTFRNAGRKVVTWAIRGQFRKRLAGLFSAFGRTDPDSTVIWQVWSYHQSDVNFTTFFCIMFFAKWGISATICWS